MSNHRNYRREAARNTVDYNDQCEALPALEKIQDYDLDLDLRTISEKEQMDVLGLLAHYFRKKSNLAVSMGALAAADRTWFEALMGDAALKALPYFDRSKGVKLTTYLIASVEHYLIDEDRKSKRQKRTAVLVPISTKDIVEAQERGMISEDGLEDRSRGGFRNLFFEMDYRNFMASLSDYEKMILEYRMDEVPFEDIVEWTGYSCSVNTFRRKVWRVIQEKAVKFGGFEGKMVTL